MDLVVVSLVKGYKVRIRHQAAIKLPYGGGVGAEVGAEVGPKPRPRSFRHLALVPNLG